MTPRRSLVSMVDMIVRSIGLRVAGVVGGLAVAIGGISRARAEQPYRADGYGYCGDPFFAPKPGRTVPANTPAFPFREDGNNRSFVLRTSAFDLVPTSQIVDPNPRVTPGLLLVSAVGEPPAPLPEGSYAWHFFSWCNPSSTTPDHTQARPFTIGPTSPLPSKAGTLRLAAPARTTTPFYCEDVRAIAQVEVVFDPLLVPFISTTQVRLSGKGVLRELADYGAETGSALNVEVEGHCSSVDELGRRTITFEANLAGFGELEPTTLDVDLACDAEAFARCKPAPISDAGSEAGAEAGDDDPNASGGCSVHAGRSTPAQPVGWLLVLAGLFRRRNRSCSPRGVTVG
jgi:hypothetical protein